MCKIAIDLNLPSVMVLRKGVFNLFILLRLRSAVHVDIGYVNNVSINSQMELTVAMINNLDKSLWRHISVLSTPLLRPSFDLRFEFVLRDVHVTAEVAVDIICFKNNPGQGIEEMKARTAEGRDFLSFRYVRTSTTLSALIFKKAKRVLAS